VAREGEAHGRRRCRQTSLARLYCTGCAAAPQHHAGCQCRSVPDAIYFPWVTPFACYAGLDSLLRRQSQLVRLSMTFAMSTKIYLMAK